jgi:type II secretory pathway component GspD/PulD (secretin)
LECSGTKGKSELYREFGLVCRLAGYPECLDLVSLLRALVQDDKATVKANPKVTTTNAQPATIYIAKEQYFSVVTGPVNYPYTRLEKVSVGIKLEITPFISQDDEITVKITPEVSDAVGYGREGLPVVDTRMVSTTVRVKDGQTITIGGLTQENTRMTQNKIPILGHIPILGYLFSHTSYEKVTSDIIIFITPNIEHEPNQK